MKVNLKNGLIKMIGLVEQLPEDTVFRMENYNDCVIGHTVGWKGKNSNYCDEQSVLRKVFGVKREDPWASYFDENNPAQHTPRTWKVIRLFTTAIGSKIDRNDWLKIAKGTLEEL